jgi:ubiquitin conjugation factor E4 B
MAKLHQSIFAYQVQLADPEFMYRNIGFTNFLSTWLIRLVDPRKAHPTPSIECVCRHAGAEGCDVTDPTL